MSESIVMIAFYFLWMETVHLQAFTNVAALYGLVLLKQEDSIFCEFQFIIRIDVFTISK